MEKWKEKQKQADGVVFGRDLVLFASLLCIIGRFSIVLGVYTLFGTLVRLVVNYTNLDCLRC